MMKALIWNAAETMNMEERPIPVPQRGEVRLRVQAVGICGSEIEGYLGHNSLRKPPLIMGHEFCGIIDELGEGVEGVKIGHKAVVNPLIFCGKCQRCLRGLTQLCDNRRIIGIHQQGAFAEWVVVPESAVHTVPDWIDAGQACLSEPLACSLRATRRALAGHPFSNVLIFGAGGIGLLCASVARLMGAAKIIIADTNPVRLQTALRLGIDDAVNPKQDHWMERVQDLCGVTGLDVVIDAAGFQPTREAAMRLLNPGGTLMNIGLGIDETRLPINYQIRSEIEILGSFCYTAKDFQYAVDLLTSGKVTGEGWTERRPLSEGGTAFADLVAGKVDVGKIILYPNDGDMN